MSDAVFTCAQCGRTFQRGRPDEEAQAEAVRNFGTRGDAPGMTVVCDDCFREIMQRIKG